MDNHKKHDLIVIGGGAAGFMGAIRAGERGLKVLVLEKGPSVARKIAISGGGRCNVTNNKYDSTHDFLKNYPRGTKFLWGPISRFSQHDFMNWLQKNGLKIKTEVDGRVFPVSDNSEDVVRTLLQAADKYKVEIKLKQQVTSLLIDKERKAIEGVKLQSGESIFADNILVACGGMSYSQTGSTGDAYKWATSAGHKVIEPKASLTGYLSSDKWVHELSGLSLNCKISLFKENKKFAEESGPVLFTHWGLSGPGIFKISSLAAGSNYKQSGFHLELNLLPELKESDLQEKLRTSWKTNPKRKVVNAIEGFIPKRLEEFIIQRTFPFPAKTVSEISKEENTKLLNYLCRLKVNISGTRPSGEEIVTAGGVCLDEVNPKTMESKLISGLYWAGEVLDIDGFTGGFNLQAAWSTGWVAGDSVLQSSL